MLASLFTPTANSVQRSAIALVLCGLLHACSGPANTGLALGEERIDPHEAAIADEMIALIKGISLTRQASDPEGIVRRFNQVKTIGCAHGEMRVDAPPHLAVGLFERPKRFPVTVRFANATQLDDREADIRGLSLRVEGVDGATGAGGTPDVQDFTFNTHPALFAGTPDVFLGFIRALHANARLRFLLTHPRAAWIGYNGQTEPSSPLEPDYFSTTPYAMGPDSAAKFAVSACDAPTKRPGADHADYLREALQQDLQSGPVCLQLKAQLQVDPNRMPIEDASVEWPETLAPYEVVAEITLPVQHVSQPPQIEACEARVFNPWNALTEHRPLGGINRVRQRIYTELGDFRAQHNQGG